MKKFKEKIWSLAGTFLLSSIVLSSVTSCGSSIPNAKTLEVKDVFVPGIASNYIEVTDGSYELQYSKDGETERILLPVTFKLKEEIGLKDPGMGYLSLKLLDAAGVTFGTPELSTDSEKVSTFLGSEAGTEVTLNFTVTNAMFGLAEGDASKIMDKTVNFELYMTSISGTHPNGSTTSMWDGELDEDTELNSGSFDDVSDIMDNAKDFTDQAMETAKEMQEEAMKQAKEMQKEAMEQAKDMYKF